MVLLLVNNMQRDFSGERSSPLSFKKSDMRFREVCTDRKAPKDLLEVE